jgi:16S rRNA (uracil1498-N3)-methyltransferase
MRIPRIYLDTTLTEGAQITLPADRFNYLRNVLRLRDEQVVCVFDGRDHQAQARLQLGRRDGFLMVDQVVQQGCESSLNTHLLQAMAKGEKMDWVIQKAVELGVHRITPIATERSVVELKAERADKRHARFIDIAISACEQSGRNTLPRIDPITPLEEALTQVAATCRWILHPVTPDSPSSAITAPGTAAVLIGPEGGFTDQELDLARQHAFEAVQLGPRVLRTETAGLVALTALQLRWGDFAQTPTDAT